MQMLQDSIFLREVTNMRQSRTFPSGWCTYNMWFLAFVVFTAVAFKKKAGRRYINIKSLYHYRIKSDKTLFIPQWGNSHVSAEDKR